MTVPHFDMIVVGAGIHGAGVAQAAAAGGYDVLVLEQYEIGSGTSSRSSKLIHGGLRYLETGQLPLVYESLHEREWLVKNAPDLVHRVPFYLPVYRQSKRGPFKIRLGLSLYALLSGLGKGPGFRKLPESEWDTLEGLETKRLCSVFQYWDAQTDDRALTQAVMRSAQTLGATLSMPARLTSAVQEEALYRVHYLQDGTTQECTTRTLVNAAGPWVNTVLECIHPPLPKVEIEWVQGTHIIISEKIKRGIYYLEAPKDGRPVFVMPWKNKMMVGTTETIFKGDPAKVVPLEEEKKYLLETLSSYFPRFQTLQLSDIESAFAGLRVLPKSNNSFGQRPRETRLVLDDANRPRLLSIYGGKLTTFRSTAKKVMSHLSKSLPKKRVKAAPEAFR